MSDRALTRLLRWFAALSVAAVMVSSGALTLAGRVNPDAFAGSFVVLVFGVLVWVVAPSQPRNPLSWVLAAGIAFISVFGLSQAAVAAWWPGTAQPEWGDIPAEFPAGVAILTGIGNVVSSTGFVMILTFGFLLFPGGRLPSRRWRWLAYIVVGAIVASGVVSGYSWRPDNASPVGPGLASDLSVATLLLPLPCLASLVFRFRRSGAQERSQVKWMLWGGSVFVLTAPYGAVAGVGWLAAVGFAALAGAYAIAIAKYRLYDIDIVISRTLVLAILAGFITIVYAAIVVGVGQFIGGDSDQLLLPILATAVVAVAFEPVRVKAQRWANQLVYGNRATPYEVLSDITERLSGADQAGSVVSRLAELLREGTGAERATVWLGEERAMVPVSTSPANADPSQTVDLDDETTHEVLHDGQIIGALEVAKPRGVFLSRAERSLMADLAGSAGAVLGYQRLNDSLAQRATELEESRARLLGVQHQERRRLEQDLHEGAEQFIVALKVKMGVGSELAARAGNEKLGRLLAELTQEAQAALDDVQSLAKGIYPPVLEAEGLGVAVSSLAASTPVEVQLDRGSVGRYPAETEAAVYFGISEAVTNAVKHANPPIHIALAETHGQLTFTVTDNGPGFDLDQSDLGSGLDNMADRLQAVGGTLRVTSASGTRTEISGTIPI